MFNNYKTIGMKAISNDGLILWEPEDPPPLYDIMLSTSAQIPALTSPQLIGYFWPTGFRRGHESCLQSSGTGNGTATLKGPFSSSFCWLYPLPLNGNGSLIFLP